MRKGRLNKTPDVCKKKGGKGQSDDRKKVSKRKKSHAYPILDHGNLVSPTSRSEPVGDPDHGLHPFPGR